MIATMHPKKTYLLRCVYAVILFFGIYSAKLLPWVEDRVNAVGIISMLLLAFLSMKVLSEVFTRLTGMSFFVSLPGMLVLFFMSAILSIIIGPLYIIFNLVQYFRSPE